MIKMTNQFFEQSILNNHYDYPSPHWVFDATGQLTQSIVEQRRRTEFITPIPKPKKQKSEQSSLFFDDGFSTQQQQHDHTAVINAVRTEVDKWRLISDPNNWNVTPQTSQTSATLIPS